MTHRAQSDSTPDIEGAISLLKSDDEQVRQFAAYLLGQAGDARAVQPLIESLADTMSACAALPPTRWASWGIRGLSPICARL
jgi:HEAT repeat protein